MPPLTGFINEHDFDENNFHLEAVAKSNEERPTTLDYDAEVVMYHNDTGSTWQDDWQATMIMDGEREHRVNMDFDVSHIDERTDFIVTLNIVPEDDSEPFTQQWELFYDPIPPQFDPELVRVSECSTTPGTGTDIHGTDSAEIYLEADNFNEVAAVADFVYWMNGKEIHREQQVAIEANGYNFWTHSFIPVDVGVTEPGDITLGGTLQNISRAQQN